QRAALDGRRAREPARAGARPARGAIAATRSGDARRTRLGSEPLSPEQRRRLPGSAAAPAPPRADAARPARVAPLRGPELDGPRDRGARASARPPPRRAGVLAAGRRADPPGRDEVRAPPRARRPAAARGAPAPRQARLRDA